MKAIPNHYLKLMNPADRLPMGKAGRTLEEIDAKAAIKSEKQLQQIVVSYIQMKGWLVFYGAFGKASNRTPGEPDLTVLLPDGITVFVELKAPKGKLTNNQPEMHAKMNGLGHTVHVVRSLDDFLSIPNVVFELGQTRF